MLHMMRNLEIERLGLAAMALGIAEEHRGTGRYWLSDSKRRYLVPDLTGHEQVHRRARGVADNPSTATARFKAHRRFLR